jgi:hypothetical protein
LKGDGKFKPEPPEMGYFQMKLRDREGGKDNKKDKCDKKEDKKVKKGENEGKKGEKREH